MNPRNEIRNADTQQAIKIFDGMVTEVLKTHPPRLTSGLVEQQAIFHRNRMGLNSSERLANWKLGGSFFR